MIRTRESAAGRALIALALAALPTMAASAAAAYPERPIRMVVPNSPGSAGDILGRIVFTQVSEALGQQIVVDNRAGAGGAIGLEIVARATPDGYTFGTTTLGSLAVAPHVNRNWKLDTFRDFAPVSVYVVQETGLMLHAKVPANTVQEFIALAKSREGRMTMASAGVGSTSHLGDAMFTTLAGIKSVHVPYKGGGPSMVAVATGESDWTVAPLVAGWSHIKAGRMRLIATGGTKRGELTPDVPTIAESGVPGFRYYGWNGVIAPKRAPQATVKRFNEVMVKVLASPEVRKLYLAQGEVPASSTPAQYAAMIRADYEHLGKIVKEAGIRAD